MPTDPDPGWPGLVLDVLRRNEVRLLAYVPDRVLAPLIGAAQADPALTTLCATREEEALGIVAGAWMGGMRGVVLMQTSGFATLPNAIASLALPYQLPVAMLVSERGTLGEFNLGQALVAKTMRPVLDSLAIEHHTLTRLDEAGFVVDRTLKQAFATRAPACLILSPLLTGEAVRMSAGLGNAPRLNRFDLTCRLVALLRQEEAVVAGIGNTNFDLWASGRRAQNFHMLGSMGLAVPIALGVAIAQPGRRVVALEGDGSLLMQLGCLATVAARQPANLLIVVMDNGQYQITGGQPTASAGACDFVAIARGCGIARADWAEDEARFEALVQAALATEGPALIAARIDAAPAVATTERDPSGLRDRFMRGLGVRGD